MSDTEHSPALPFTATTALEGTSRGLADHVVIDIAASTLSTPSFSEEVEGALLGKILYLLPLLKIELPFSK